MNVLLWCAVFVTKLMAITVCSASNNQNSTCRCVCGLQGRFTRIVGGQETHPHTHPWSTALLKNEILYCGATIITSSYLITAAHCIYSFKPSEILIYIGGHRIIDDRSEIKRISSILHHEKFDAVTFDNDIGLIKVASPVVYGPKTQPACLPTFKSHVDYSGEIGLVTGWGRTGENMELSSVLKYINVPIWSQARCEQSGYGIKRLTPNMMCAGYEEGLFDACQGDSGGSMLRLSSSGNVEVIGIVSWGRGCARANYPGIYTIVNNYKQWINRFLSSECICSKK